MSARRAAQLTRWADKTLEMTATIRHAVIGDEEQLAKLNGFVQDLHLERRPDHFKPTKIPELAGWYRSLLEKSTARMWIAEEEGLPVGYILAIVHRRTDNPFCQARNWCEIDQIAVDPKYRRQGIARSLILKAIAEVKADGIRDIEATSWSFNQETHAVLRRLGFVPKTVRFELTSSPESQVTTEAAQHRLQPTPLGAIVKRRG